MEIKGYILRPNMGGFTHHAFWDWMAQVKEK